MKPRSVIVMLVILAMAVPVQMLAEGNKAEQEVRAVIDDITQANTKDSATAISVFDRYFADDYVRILSNGTVASKADILDGVRTGKSTFGSLDLSDVKIRIYGHTAVVTGVLHGKGTLLGVKSPGGSRFTRVLVKRDGLWKSTVFQTTPIAQKTGTPAAQAANQLVGTYRLVSYKRTVVATGETTDILGKAPQGYIIYGLDGRMMVFLVKDDRPKPSDLATMTDQERVDLYKTMLAYSGTYDFDGKTVTHHIDVSWNQIWTGTSHVREVRLDGRKLILTANPEPSGRDGNIRLAVLTFEKVD